MVILQEQGSALGQGHVMMILLYGCMWFLCFDKRLAIWHKSQKAVREEHPAQVCSRD